MEKSSNDQLILNLKQEVELKKEALKKVKKFSPITNCSLELFNIRYNIHTLDKSNLLLILAQLQSLKLSLHSVLVEETIIIGGYNVDEWITDIRNKFEEKNYKTEEERLKNLESKLHNLLSTDTKISIELDEIKKMI